MFSNNRCLSLKPAEGYAKKITEQSNALIAPKFQKDFLLHAPAIINNQQEIAHQGLGSNRYNVLWKSTASPLIRLITRRVISKNKMHAASILTTFSRVPCFFLRKRKVSAKMIPIQRHNVKICGNCHCPL